MGRRPKGGRVARPVQVRVVPRPVVQYIPPSRPALRCPLSPNGNMITLRVRESLVSLCLHGFSLVTHGPCLLTATAGEETKDGVKYS
jgi:hypothetical protein